MSRLWARCDLHHLLVYEARSNLWALMRAMESLRARENQTA